jgi:hypothetical protein
VNEKLQQLARQYSPERRVVVRGFRRVWELIDPDSIHSHERTVRLSEAQVSTLRATEPPRTFIEFVEALVALAPEFADEGLTESDFWESDEDLGLRDHEVEIEAPALAASPMKQSLKASDWERLATQSYPREDPSAQTWAFLRELLDLLRHKADRGEV